MSRVIESCQPTLKSASSRGGRTSCEGPGRQQIFPALGMRSLLPTIQLSLMATVVICKWMCVAVFQ